MLLRALWLLLLLLTMPLSAAGGHTKFVIRRDPASKLYYTLSNVNTDAQFQDQRNILILAASNDTTTWFNLGVLLADDTGLAGTADSARYTGFHYVDWQVRCSILPSLFCTCTGRSSR